MLRQIGRFFVPGVGRAPYLGERARTMREHRQSNAAQTEYIGVSERHIIRVSFDARGGLLRRMKS